MTTSKMTTIELNEHELDAVANALRNYHDILQDDHHEGGDHGDMIDLLEELNYKLPFLDEAPYIGISFDMTPDWESHSAQVQYVTDHFKLELDSGAGFGRRDFEGTHSLNREELDFLTASLRALDLPNLDIHAHV